MRRLIVNGEYLYDPIEGDEHAEGQPAQICVTQTPRLGALPRTLALDALGKKAAAGCYAFSKAGD